MTKDDAGRLSAALIAAAALLAMIPPMMHGLAQGDGLLPTILGMLRWFTILTNLLVGLIFARLAWKGADSVPPLVLGGVMLAIVLVGAVYNFVLTPIPHQTIWDAIGDSAHHQATPLLVPLWWIFFGRHGQLSWGAPLLWALYPLAYSLFSIGYAQTLPADGSLPTRYPYFFMDIDRLGLPAVALNLFAISAGFVLVGLLAVLADRLLAAQVRDRAPAAG